MEMLEQLVDDDSNRISLVLWTGDVTEEVGRCFTFGKLKTLSRYMMLMCTEVSANLLLCISRRIRDMIEQSKIHEIKGVGEKTEKLFAKLGIYTVGDLLRYYPRNYDVYEEAVPIAEVEDGRTVTVTGMIFGRGRWVEVGTCR